MNFSNDGSKQHSRLRLSDEEPREKKTRQKGLDKKKADLDAAELPVSKSVGMRSNVSSREDLDDSHSETLPLTLHAHVDTGPHVASSSSSQHHHEPHHHHHHHHHHAHTHPHPHAVIHVHPHNHSSHGMHGVEKCGTVKTLGNIFISFVGAGVLALPYAFAKSGIMLGTAFMILVASLALYCIHLLVDCKRVLESKGVATYSEVVETCMGVWGKRLVEVLLVLSQTGFCITYLVFIGTNLSHLSHLQKVSIICMVVPFQVGLAMLKNLAALAPFSLLADAAIVLGMLVVLGDDVMAFRMHSTVVMSRGASAVPFLFGVVIYCYEGIGMILPLEDSMKDKSKFKSTLSTGFVMITAVFLTFGLVGYAAYGEDTNATITLNLPDGLGTAAVQVSLCIGLFFTFPVMMVPVYEIADRALDASPWFEKHVSPLKQDLLRRLGRCCTIVTLGIVAASVCNFAVFISFIGSFACALLAFIMPSLCHLILFQGKMSTFGVLADCLLIAFGVVGMLFGVRDSLEKLGEHSSC